MRIQIKTVSDVQQERATDEKDSIFSLGILIRCYFAIRWLSSNTQDIYTSHCFPFCHTNPKGDYCSL